MVEQESEQGKPVELSEEGKEEVHRMASAYRDKPTTVMPGTDRTITGTAINEWLDDDGNPKFGDPQEHPFAEDPLAKTTATTLGKRPIAPKTCPPSSASRRTSRAATGAGLRQPRNARDSRERRTDRRWSRRRRGRGCGRGALSRRGGLGGRRLRGRRRGRRFR
ncbi:hypothetical protein I553_8015 [Mycobacterium xenopi 4042]|uniref:Uncharacterized protein n=1 Tax=Mycobacterium xenopi 4042 TaxID=1299334 RepID=X8DAG3_MYCXE|nr:hypothetical protein I553_8015 [Mycobacterium xenopi 4042]